MFRFLQCCVYSLNIMIFFREKRDREKTRKLLSILLIPVGIIRYLYISLVSYKCNSKSKCAIVVIVKNEARYLNEYLDYYTLLGCDVILYDNESSDDTKSIVEKYKNVKYIWWPGKKRQIDAYNHACKKFNKKYKYMMFFDADEFLVCDEQLKGVKLIDILNQFFDKDHQIGCLGINWLIFGSGGLVDYPEKGVIDSFICCAKDSFEWNQLVKSCVKPEKIVGWVNPHLPLTTLGAKRVNTDYKKINSPRNKLPHNKSIRLHHYFVKNKKHFIDKVEKGMADRDAKRKIDEFYYYDKNDCINKKAIQVRKFLKQNKKG